MKKKARKKKARVSVEFFSTFEFLNPSIVSPQSLNVYCLKDPVEPEYSPALTEDFTGMNWDINAASPDRYPLMEELGVLNELVDNMRVDFLHSSMLLSYIKDYLRKSDISHDLK